MNRRQFDEESCMKRRNRRKRPLLGSKPMKSHARQDAVAAAKSACPNDEWDRYDDTTSESDTSSCMSDSEDDDFTSGDEYEGESCPRASAPSMYMEPKVITPTCPTNAHIGVTMQQAVSHIESRMSVEMEPKTLLEAANRAFVEEFNEISDGVSIGSNISYEDSSGLATVSYTYKFVHAPKNVGSRSCKSYRKSDKSIILNVPKKLLFTVALKHLMRLHGRAPVPPGLWEEMRRRAKSAGFRHKVAPVVTYQYSNFPYHLTVSLSGTTRKFNMGNSHKYDLMTDPYNYSCRKPVSVPLSAHMAGHSDAEVNFLKSVSNDHLDKTILPSAAHNDQMYYLHYHTPMGMRIKEYVIAKDLGGQAWNLKNGVHTSEKSVRMDPSDARILKKAFIQRRDSCITVGELPVVLNVVAQDDDDSHCPSAWYMKSNRGPMFEQKRKFIMSVTFKLMVFV